MAFILLSEMSKSRLRLMGAQNYPATMQCVGGVHAGWVEVQAGVGRWGCGGPDVAPSPGDTEPRDQCQALWPLLLQF